MYMNCNSKQEKKDGVITGTTSITHNKLLCYNTDKYLHGGEYMCNQQMLQDDSHVRDIGELEAVGARNWIFKHRRPHWQRNRKSLEEHGN